MQSTRRWVSGGLQPAPSRCGPGAQQHPGHRELVKSAAWQATPRPCPVLTASPSALAQIGGSRGLQRLVKKHGLPLRSADMELRGVGTPRAEVQVPSGWRTVRPPCLSHGR